MRIKRPLISVLLPVFNSEKYLGEAIKSILDQTFTDFELLVIDDGSTDSSVAIARSFPDKRIHVIANKKHQGLVPVLNQGLRVAKGKYLARMDSDDISLPCRLEKQFAFMEEHPEIGICGTWYRVFGPGVRERLFTRPITPTADKALLPFGDPIHHPTAMVRLELLRRFNLEYDSSYRHLEDWEFWNRCSKFFDFANIGEVLFLYRFHNEQVGHLYKPEQIIQTKRVQGECIRDLGIRPTKKIVNLHWQISTRRLPHSRIFVNRAGDWLSLLVSANSRSQIYDPVDFRKEIGSRWFYVCSDCSNLGWWTAKKYWSATVRSTPSLIGLVVFLIRCALASGVSSISGGFSRPS